jgi:hypothetical protein
MRYSEYYHEPLTYDLILSVRLRNAIKKAFKGEENCLDINLKNISINGQKRGCSGFIRNKVNGNVVYVNTEDPMWCGYLRRYAEDTNDYSGRGGFNQFSKDFDTFVKDLVSMIAKERRIEYRKGIGAKYV